MVGSVLVIADAQFEQTVLKEKQPVLVYFWAPWCGPCRLVSPSIESLASEYSDRLKFVKMEVDPNPETVKKYKVEGVPAFRLFKKGEEVLSHEGAITKQAIKALLDENLP